MTLEQLRWLNGETRRFEKAFDDATDEQKALAIGLFEDFILTLEEGRLTRNTIQD